MLKAIDAKHFLPAIPHKPMGRYAHLVVLRMTDSYSLFQTDGELNKARVQAGLKDKTPMTRIALFKRKQSSPERLEGRQLLRRYGLVAADCPAHADGAKFVVEREMNSQIIIPLEPMHRYDWKKNECLAGAKNCAEQRGKDSKSCSVVCDYNVAFCMRCPDCITYGFAIGDSGSEKSRVHVDTAYSLTPYEDSHDTFTLNAPYEDGTMSRSGETTSRINSQDHVRPQVFFPSVVTIKDPTEAMFLYVVNNVMRSKSYGAQTTRTGSMRNIILGLVFADGEIFSNLKLTQAVYDSVKSQYTPPDPLAVDSVSAAVSAAAPELLKGDGVSYDDFFGDELEPVLADINAITTNETDLQQLLSQAYTESDAYAAQWIFAKPSEEKKSKGRKAQK